MTAKYKIFEYPPNQVTVTRPSIKDVKGAPPYFLSLVWLISFGISWIIFEYYYCGGICAPGGRDNAIQTQGRFGGGFFAVAAATIITIIVNYLVKAVNIPQQHHQLISNAQKREKERVEKETIELTSSVQGIYDDSLEIKNELVHHLQQTSSWLKRAELEFNESAFAPYWDAIEKATIHLAKYYERVEELSETATLYYELLENEKHTFPIFPVKPENLPNPQQILAEFRKIYRLGQTKYEFAQIWEHYKDRKVMVAGFSHLGDAMNNMAYAIEQSISHLQTSISSDLAHSVEEGIKTKAVISQVGEQVDNRLVEIHKLRK